MLRTVMWSNYENKVVSCIVEDTIIFIYLVYDGLLDTWLTNQNKFIFIYFLIDWA